MLAGQLTMVDEAELEAELETIMMGISTAASISISIDSKKSQENVVDSVSNTPYVPKDPLVLPDVPKTPLLLSTPLNGVGVEKKRIVAVSEPP